MRVPEQLTFSEDPVFVEATLPRAGREYGEVFTRRWVVELILDLVGYVADEDLGAQALVEPSCGAGAFLVPAIERLIESARAHGRELASLAPAIRAFDLLESNASIARKAAAACLTDAGLFQEEADEVAARWIVTGDFLLHDHADAPADFVVGNPPYIRLEDVSAELTSQYRRRCPAMRGRADIYVGFIERSLGLLRDGGRLGFICADRWMHNQYGSSLRKLVSDRFAVDAIVAMHDVDAFEEEVSAYPAIVVLRNGEQRDVKAAEASRGFDVKQAGALAAWVRGGRSETISAPGFSAVSVPGGFDGGDLWPTASPSQLQTLRELETRFGPLEDPATGTRVGIGVATGCDEVFITRDGTLVEAERLLPLLQAEDLVGGAVSWSRGFLVNPWDEDGLADPERFPRFRDYLATHEERLRRRHVATRRPNQWFRTIDRVNLALMDAPRLVLPDLKAAAYPVLDVGRHYPHHNLYHVTSRSWDLEVLGGLLLSDIANLFVGAYCVKMRGGCYRFQAQYIRRIRVPEPSALSKRQARALAAAFRDRDVERATGHALSVYGLEPWALAG